MEYMLTFPGQARELGREIAAFATSNAGLILLGVADNGDLVGLNAMGTAVARDELLRRLEGICRGMVKPSITPSVAFAVEDDDKVALVISVPKGGQPVYYCNDIPYVRHITQSRPAEPHEVVEIVVSSRTGPVTLATAVDDAVVRFRDLASRVAGAAHEVLILSDQLQERSVNPHFQDLKSQIAYSGQVARAIAATDEAINEGVVQRLVAFADAAEAVGTHRMYLGAESWAQFTALVQEASTQAAALDRELVQRAQWPPEAEQWARRRLRELSREVSQVSERADRAMQDGRVAELQGAIAARGQEIERLAYLGLCNANPEWLAQLKAVAKRLHLVETKRLYVDGGRAWRELLESIHTSAAELAVLAA